MAQKIEHHQNEWKQEDLKQFEMSFVDLAALQLTLSNTAGETSVQPSSSSYNR